MHPGTKEVSNPDGILFSMPREIESMVQKILEVSQKRMPRETESAREKSFNMKDRLRHDESSSEISMNSEKMHISIWTRCMASSMQAAFHMDPSHEKNLKLFKNFEFKNIHGLFGITRKLIEGNSEIKNVFPSSLWENPYCLKNKQ